MSLNSLRDDDDVDDGDDKNDADRQEKGIQRLLNPIENDRE